MGISCRHILGKLGKLLAIFNSIWVILGTGAACKFRCCIFIPFSILHAAVGIRTNGVHCDDHAYRKQNT